MNNEIVFSNLIWRFAERMGAQLIGFIVSVVLARMLEPSAYGTVALITVFTTILQVFVDSGLGNALIQKKDADEVDFSTVFFTNIIFCAILYIGLYISSPHIAYFYGDEKICPYMRVLGLTVLVSGIKNIQQAYVSRNMLFKRFFFSTLGGTIIAGTVGVLMAYNGWGVWALVAQQVTNLTIDTIILWITVKWRPRFVYSFERLVKLYTFGWKLLASSLIDTIYMNIRQLMIGKIYTSSDLARYNRGKQFPDLVARNINTSINSVLLPAMSKEQEYKEKLKNMTRKSIKVSVYVMAPIMMGLAFCGNSIVGLILTEKWLPCVFYMQIFCVTYMFYPIHTANLTAINAMGRSDIYLKLEIQKKIVGMLALLTTVFISVEAMAYSLLFTSVISQVINATPNKKLLNYGYCEQLKDILPSIGLSLLMGGIVYPVQYAGFSYFITLIIQIPLGVIVYLLGSLIFKVDSFTYLLQVAKKYFKKEEKRNVK